MPPEPSILLTTQEAAKVAGYTPTYLRALCRVGKIRATRNGSDWVISYDDLESFIAEVEAHKVRTRASLAQERKAEYERKQAALAASAAASVPVAANAAPASATASRSANRTARTSHIRRRMPLVLASGFVSAGILVAAMIPSVPAHDSVTNAPQVAAAEAATRGAYDSNANGMAGVLSAMPDIKMKVQDAFVAFGESLRRTGDVVIALLFPESSYNIARINSSNGSATYSGMNVGTNSATTSITYVTNQNYIATSTVINTYPQQNYFPQVVMQGIGRTEFEQRLATLSNTMRRNVESAMRSSGGSSGGSSSGGSSFSTANPTFTGTTTAEDVNATGNVSIGGNMQVDGDANVTGTLTVGNFAVSNLSSNNAVVAPSFIATSTSAASQFTTINASSTVTDNATTTNLYTDNLTIGSLTGVLRATAGVVSTSLVSLASDITGVLGVGNGGTGTSTPTGILVGNGGGLLQTLTLASPLSLTGSTLSINQANSAQNGYLSSADWNTFNNKVSSTSLSGGTGISYSPTTGVITNTGVTSTAGDWTGTFDGQEGSYYLANSFSTTSAMYFLSQQSVGGFSTTSANYWESQQTPRTADDLSDNSIEDLGDVAAMTQTVGDLLSWNGTAWTNVSTSSLGIVGGGGGGPVTWGTIIGTLSSQTDLQNALDAKFSLSAWYATTTDALDEGSTNLYFTETRARESLSFSGSGLAYDDTTGVLSVAPGYSIPLSASTTEWNTAYTNRITSASAPLSISSNVISISQAGSGSDGYLSSTDWNTFNNKISSTSLSGGSGISYNPTTGVITNTGVTSTSGDWTGTFDGQEGSYYLNRANHTGSQTASTISDFSTAARALFSGTAPITYNSGTGAFGITQSGAATDGYLSSTDWNTFNNKVSSTSLSGGTGISYDPNTGVISNTGVTSTAGDWTGTFDGQEGSYYLANSFSTTSANYLLSTIDKGFFFSTTSANFWESTQTPRTADDLSDNTTTDLAEGSNLYYTLARWSTAMAGTTTDALAEGSTNLYFTNDRADARIGAATSTIRGMISAGTGIAYDSSTGVISNTGLLTTSGDWTGTFDGQEGTYYLDRANHTGMQLASTISDFSTAARALFSGTAPITYNSGTGAFGITQSGAATDGYLSSTDWNTFNNKENALTFTYPLQRTSNTISLAFGTTTTNTWSQLQTFSSGINVNGETFTDLTGTGLSNVGGVLTVSTSSLALDTTYFKQGGNSFGATAVLGTNDTNALQFETNNATALTIDSSGSVGIATTTTNDYLLTLDGNSTNDNSRVLSILQNNNAGETNYGMYLANSSNLGVLTSSLNAYGANFLVNPTASIQTVAGNVIPEVYGTNTTLDVSGLSIDNAAGSQSRYMLYGTRSTIDGTLTVSDTTSAGFNSVTTYGTHVSASSDVNFTGTDQVNYTSYGGYFFNDSALTGGIMGSRFGISTDVTGAGSGNYGLNIGSVSGADFNIGVNIASISAAAGNYALYSTSAAQSSFAGSVGIGTTSPYAKLSIDGDIALTGGIYDNNASRGTNGMVLQSTGTGVQWVATSTLGISGGSSNAFVQGGNSFSELATLGTNDSNALAFETNNVEAMRILVNGNIGIGTTTPTARLTVADNGGSVNIGGFFGLGYGAMSLNGTADGTNYNFLSGSLGVDNSLYINRPSGGAINFREANGTSQMYIAPGGNVGIGTTSPSGPLSIERSADTNVTSFFTNPNTGTNATADFAVRNGYGAGDALYITALGTNYGGSGVFGADTGLLFASSGLSGGLSVGTGAATPLRLFTNNAEVMRIMPGGNIGIGTTSPLTRLTVVGTTTTTGTNFQTTNSAGVPVLTSLDSGRVGVGTTNIDTDIFALARGSIGLGESGISTSSPIARADFSRLYLRQGELPGYQFTTSTPGSAATTTYNYTGSNQTFTVPAGVTSVFAKMWGAGGGGGGSGSGALGGGGGYSHATIATTPGENLTIRPGGGGAAGSGTYGGGGGGGRSDILRGSAPVLVAGGGGGATGGYGFGAGGAGGGSTAANGQVYANTSNTDGSTWGAGGGGSSSGSGNAGGFGSNGGGGGGSPISGGAGGGGAGAGGGTTGGNASSGASGGGGGTSGGGNGFQTGAGGGGAGGGSAASSGGGAGGSSTFPLGGAGSTGSGNQGGGGGGGYGGGGGGGGAGGGGGGAGFASSTATTNATLTAGSGTTPGNSGDTDRSSAGTGGATATAGSAGRILIGYTTAPTSSTTTVPTITTTNPSLYMRTSGNIESLLSGWGVGTTTLSTGAPNSTIYFNDPYGGRGNIGIGTTSALAKLTVVGTGTTTGQTFRLENANSAPILTVLDSGKFTLNTPTNLPDALNVTNAAGTTVFTLGTEDTSGSIFSIATSTGTSYLEVTADGKIGIATTSPWRTLSVVGTMAANGLTTSASGNYVCINTSTWELTRGNGSACSTSSGRYKEDIENLAYGLDTINAMRPVSFAYKPELNIGSSTKVGFIAEEMLTLVPEVVNIGEDGLPSGIDYPSLTAVLASGIQELSARTISMATSSLAFRLNEIETRFGEGENAAPEAITVTTLTAGSASISNALSAGSVTASLFVAPLAAGDTLPETVLTTNGVDLYKLGSAAFANTQSLTARFDAADLVLDDIQTRLAALEEQTSSWIPTTGFSGLFASAMGGWGAVMESGIPFFQNLKIGSLFVAKSDDGGSAAGAGTILSGNTVVEIVNPLAKPESKIFITLTSPIEGSWYLSEKNDGNFRVRLAEPQQNNVTFDYFIVQTEGDDETEQPDQQSQSFTPQSEPSNDPGPIFFTPAPAPAPEPQPEPQPAPEPAPEPPPQPEPEPIPAPAPEPEPAPEPQPESSPITP